MFLVDIRRRVEDTIENGPRWMRWLAIAAPAAHEANRRMRRTVLRFQFPLVILLTCSIVATKYFGLFDPAYRVPFWLGLAAFTVMFWPVPAMRLGTAAYRGLSTSPAQFRFLRLLAGLCVLYAGMASCLLILVLWLVLGAPGLAR